MSWICPGRARVPPFDPKGKAALSLDRGTAISVSRAAGVLAAVPLVCYRPIEGSM